MKLFSRLIATLIASSFVVPLVAGNNDAAEAQNADRAMFGVRAVCDITNSRTVSEITDWGAGGAAGISFYIPFGKLTYFSPAFLVGCETVKLDGVAGTEEKPYYFDGNIKTIGMRFPLEFGIKLFRLPNIMVSVYTGPHIFINFGVKGKYDKSTDKVTISYDKTLDDYKCFELDWGAGISVDIKRHWNVRAGCKYGLTQFAQMDKVYPGETSKFKRIAISVGLGYNFNL